MAVWKGFKSVGVNTIVLYTADPKGGNMELLALVTTLQVEEHWVFSYIRQVIVCLSMCVSRSDYPLDSEREWVGDFWANCVFLLLQY